MLFLICQTINLFCLNDMEPTAIFGDKENLSN